MSFTKQDFENEFVIACRLPKFNATVDYLSTYRFEYIEINSPFADSAERIVDGNQPFEDRMKKLCSVGLRAWYEKTPAYKTALTNRGQTALAKAVESFVVLLCRRLACLICIDKILALFDSRKTASTLAGYELYSYTERAECDDLQNVVSPLSHKKTGQTIALSFMPIDGTPQSIDSPALSESNVMLVAVNAATRNVFNVDNAKMRDLKFGLLRLLS